MKLWVSVALVMLVAAGTTVSAESGTTRSGGEAVPWPWGTECPFPWAEFNGYWMERNDLSEDLWQFKKLSQNEHGVRYFQIDRFNQDGDRVAFGRGSANSEDRIIRAGMKLANVQRPERKKAETNNYWAIVRTYVEEKEKFDCVRDKKVMVLTLRPASATTGRKDIHYVIRKVVESGLKK